jgi:hypothetical protein
LDKLTSLPTHSIYIRFLFGGKAVSAPRISDGVIRVVSSAPQLRPYYPNDRTFSTPTGSSAECHNRKIAASHSITSSARARNDTGISMPSAGIQPRSPPIGSPIATAIGPGYRLGVGPGSMTPPGASPRSITAAGSKSAIAGVRARARGRSARSMRQPSSPSSAAPVLAQKCTWRGKWATDDPG